MSSKNKSTVVTIRKFEVTATKIIFFYLIKKLRLEYFDQILKWRISYSVTMASW